MQNQLSPEQARERIRELTRSLQKSEAEYYDNSAPVLEDAVFDQMMSELRRLEEDFPEFADPKSPARKVGGGVSGANFERSKHRRPMLSLENIYTRGELENWYAGLLKQTGREKIELFCELKIDGVAISILFENGELSKAVTRGDGEEGDLVTQNVARIRKLPSKIEYSGLLEMRGEIYVAKSDFDALNRERSTQNLELYKNPRNLASGSVRMKNPEAVEKRNLSLFIYDLLSEDFAREHDQNLEFARQLNFPVNPYSQKIQSPDEVLRYCEKWEKEQEDLPFEIDGVVIKVNSPELREKIGFRSKSPKWAVAWKFQMERARTRLISVENSIGRSGVLTPVANLEPVHLMGTVVKRASLHNYSQIERLGIRTGDLLIIEKGGEIIPKVVGIEITERPPESRPLLAPENCPACGSKLVPSESKIDLKCIHVNCPATLFGKLKHFVSKKAMDIRSLGEANLRLFIEEGLIQTIADIYRLEKNSSQILTFEGFGKKSLENLFSAIRESKNVRFYRLIHGLGIPGVGEKASKTLEILVRSPENLKNLKQEDLENLPDFGPIITESILYWISREENLRLIEELIELGMNPTIPQNIDIPTTEGETFVITGKLSKPREEWAKILEENGYKVTSAVSKNTTYLLCGESPGSKARKAKELGIPVLTEDQAEEKIRGGN